MRQPKWMAYVVVSLFYFAAVAQAEEVPKLGVNNLSYIDFASAAGKAVKGITPINALAYATGDGVADDTAKLQAAIDAAVTGAGVLLIPAGTYVVSSTLTIDNAVTIMGAGASQHGNVDRTGTKTIIRYTGIGPAIKLLGTGSEGKENIHLSDFAIVGTAAADGGILAGSKGPVHKSSFKNLLLAGFTNSRSADVGYGFRADNLYTSIFQNVYAHDNRDGFNIYGHATTLHFINTNSRSNARYGYNIQYMSGSKFFGSMAEDNHDTGLYINTRAGGYSFHNDFFGFYSEANYKKAIEITATGTGLSDLMNFFGGSIQETNAVSPRIKLGKCRWIWFNGTGIPTHATGYIEVDATNTQYSGFRHGFNPNEADTRVTWSATTGMPNFHHTDYRTWGPVKFTATEHRASDANTLDDYEEGTWTPVWSDATTGGNIGTPTNNFGYYTKVGNMVTITGGADSINTTGMTRGNTLYVRGVPFAPNKIAIGTGTTNAGATDNLAPVPIIGHGATYLSFRHFSESGPAHNMKVSEVTSKSTQIYFSATYLTTP